MIETIEGQKQRLYTISIPVFMYKDCGNPNGVKCRGLDDYLWHRHQIKEWVSVQSPSRSWEEWLIDNP